MGKGNVWVDLAGEGGVPLFKKFAMFDYGFVPAERTCRDAALFRRCRISSLRMDLFIGEPAAEFGSMVEETPEGLHYNWEKADRLVKVLKKMEYRLIFPVAMFLCRFSRKAEISAVFRLTGRSTGKS